MNAHFQEFLVLCSLDDSFASVEDYFVQISHKWQHPKQKIPYAFGKYSTMVSRFFLIENLDEEQLKELRFLSQAVGEYPFWVDI